MSLRLEKFNKDLHTDLWDYFVENNSINGTIFHTRKFLSYHAENRFNDASILIYDGEELAAVMNAAKADDGFHSHPGTTGGGIVLHEKYYRLSKLEPIVDLVLDYYNQNISIRLTEDIFYNKESNSLLLYLLGRKKTVVRELSMNISLNYDKDGVNHIIRSSTRSAVRKYYKDGYVVRIADDEDIYVKYHEILTDNLVKFGSVPVHNCNELLELRNILGEKQLLIIGEDEEGNMLGGVWLIKATDKAWHTQYIAKNYQFGIHSVIPSIVAYAIDLFKENDIENFNLGPCTEENGSVLNSTLAEFKESLGAKGVNRYKIS